MARACFIFLSIPQILPRRRHISLLRILILYFILSLSEMFSVIFIAANRAQRKCSLSTQLRSVFHGLWSSLSNVWPLSSLISSPLLYLWRRSVSYSGGVHIWSSTGDSGSLSGRSVWATTDWTRNWEVLFSMEIQTKDYLVSSIIFCIFTFILVHFPYKSDGYFLRTATRNILSIQASLCEEMGL